MRNSDGIIFNIQRCSLHDGPGVRSTAFLKGCSLACQWCQNPEGIKRERETLFDKAKCISCGECAQISDVFDAAKNCPSGARRVCGEIVSADELANRLLEDREFYAGGGGVTFSGGECLLQADFVADVSRILKESNIHIAIDTCGNVPREALKKVLPYADLFLYDIKAITSDLHKRFTGADNHLILENFEWLNCTGAKIWVRVPIINTFNAHGEEIEKIKSYLDRFDRIEKIEALKYHELGVSKYSLLDRQYKLGDEAKLSDEQFNEIATILNK